MGREKRETRRALKSPAMEGGGYGRANVATALRVLIAFVDQGHDIASLVADDEGCDARELALAIAARAAVDERDRGASFSHFVLFSPGARARARALSLRAATVFEADFFFSLSLSQLSQRERERRVFLLLLPVVLLLLLLLLLLYSTRMTFGCVCVLCACACVSSAFSQK